MKSVKDFEGNVPDLPPQLSFANQRKKVFSHAGYGMIQWKIGNLGSQKSPNASRLAVAAKMANCGAP